MENYSRALKPNEVCRGGFQNCLGLVTGIFLSFSPYCNGNVCNCYSVPEPPLYLEAENLFSSFTSPQMERNFALKWVISRVSPTPNVDDINDEMSEL